MLTSSKFSRSYSFKFFTSRKFSLVPSSGINKSFYRSSSLSEKSRIHTLSLKSVTPSLLSFLIARPTVGFKTTSSYQIVRPSINLATFSTSEKIPSNTLFSFLNTKTITTPLVFLTLLLISFSSSSPPIIELNSSKISSVSASFPSSVLMLRRNASC